MGNTKSSPETQSDVINLYIKNHNITNLITNYLRDLSPLPFLKELHEVSRHKYDLSIYQFYSNFREIDIRDYCDVPGHIKQQLEIEYVNPKSDKIRVYNPRSIHIIKFCLSCCQYHIGKVHHDVGSIQVVICSFSELSRCPRLCVRYRSRETDIK